MRDEPLCLLGVFVVPTADGGSRLLVGVFPRGCVATNYPTPEKKIAGFTGIYRDKPGCRFARAQADPGPVFGPERRCRGFNNLRALAQIRSETGSLETAPSATQSCRCSHSGIARSSFPFFSLFLGRLHRSREGCQGSETRPGRGGSRSAGDRLASPVPWSGLCESLAPPRGRRTSDRASARPNTVPLPVRRCADGSRIPLDPSYVPEYPGSKLLIAGIQAGWLGPTG